MPNTLTINPQEASFHELAPAARLLLDGGVVACPTDTFYALVALVDNHKAMEKVLHLKGEQERQGKANIILLDQVARVMCYAREIPEEAVGLMTTFWPGPLTLLFLAQNGLHHSLVGPARTVALRQEGSILIRNIVRMADRGVTGTSANPAGAPPAKNAREVLEYFGDRIDMVIDGGTTEGGLPSTIIDVSLGAPRIVRDGCLRAGDLMAACPILRL